MHLLITVGTTQFIDLINLVMENITVLTDAYEKVTVQTGSQKLKNDYSHINNLEICSYIDNLNMRVYDVILCHCGTGSILDGLKHGKKVVAVVNEDLKNNHQSETAKVFAKYLYVKNLDNVVNFVAGKVFTDRKKFKLKVESSFLKNLINC